MWVLVVVPNTCVYSIVTTVIVCVCIPHIFAGIRMHFVRSLACIVGVLLYLAEVTYQDYREDKRPLELENKTLSETLLIQ